MSTPRKLALATAVTFAAIGAGWGLLHWTAIGPFRLASALGSLLLGAGFIAVTGWALRLDESAYQSVPGQENPPAAARRASTSEGGTGALAGHPQHARTLTEEWETAPADLPAAMDATSPEPAFAKPAFANWKSGDFKAFIKAGEMTP